MIRIISQGNFKNTEKFLSTMSKKDIFSSLKEYGQKGVNALANATPSRTGLTPNSWDYEVQHLPGSWTITWINDNIVDGTPLVILLQYGHATGTGGYVQGRDFINPAIVPIFDQIAADVWKAVTSA